jgi:hypothetical protein
MGKGFDDHNIKIAAHEDRIRYLQLHIGDLTRGGAPKLPPNPNTRFVDVIQVEETRQRPEE